MANETVKYSVADKKKIKSLVEADVTLTGKETTDELDALMAANLPDSGEDLDEIVLPGVPNAVPQVYEPLEPGSDPRKVKRFPLFQVLPVKGGFALYNQKGKRVSPVCRPDRIHGRDADIKDKQPGEVSEYAYIAKACARTNAERRARTLPGDPQE